MTAYLVTGGSGTFGRAFIPHALKQGAERVVALARDEVRLAELERDFPHPNLRCYVGDIRDLERLKIALRHIDVVIHAAAMKRIEQCERDPMEAVENNINGTNTLIKAILHTESIKKAVLLSSDKATAPINLYGITKLCAEHLWLKANNYAAGRCHFTAVRYGNVWRSRGSVVELWLDRLIKGLPIRVTDPMATRFFMTQAMAVDLVMQALRLEYDPLAPTKVLMPSLDAYSLEDLIIALGDPPCEMTALQPYEKLHEQLGDLHSDKVRRMTIDELKHAIGHK